MRYGNVEKNDKGEITWINFYSPERVFQIKKWGRYIDDKEVSLPRWVCTLPNTTKIMVTSNSRRWGTTVGRIKKNIIRFKMVRVSGFLRHRVFVPIGIGKMVWRLKERKINKLTMWRN